MYHTCTTYTILLHEFAKVLVFTIVWNDDRIFVGLLLRVSRCHSATELQNDVVGTPINPQVDEVSWILCTMLFTSIHFASNNAQEHKCRIQTMHTFL